MHQSLKAVVRNVFGKTSGSLGGNMLCSLYDTNLADTPPHFTTRILNSIIRRRTDNSRFHWSYHVSHNKAGQGEPSWLLSGSTLHASRARCSEDDEQSLVCPENVLIELTESIHMVLFLVMMLFMIETILVIRQGKRKMREWRQHEELSEQFSRCCCSTRN